MMMNAVCCMMNDLTQELQVDVKGVERAKPSGPLQKSGCGLDLIPHQQRLAMALGKGTKSA